MITYLLTTTLLSIIGWLLYIVLVRDRASFIQQKSFIYGVLVLSLSLPLITAQKPLYHPHPEVKPMGWAKSINPVALQTYCKCENPDYTHRIHYRANEAYSFLFQYKRYLLWVVLLAIGGVMTHFILQLNYLRTLVRHSEKSAHQIDGKRFFLLVPPQNHAVGAFGFKNKYIIWQKHLDELPASEKEAIFRHELSHLNQYNTLEKLILRMIQCLWILNPAFYLFRKELLLISECMADQAATTGLSRKQYAKLLIKVQEGLFSPLTAYLKGSELSIRIHRLIKPKKQSRMAFPIALSLLLSIQLYSVGPFVKNISEGMHKLQTFEKVYHQAPEAEEAYYCPDCETVCTPDFE